MTSMPDPARLDLLIGSLSADLAPVKRLRPPVVRAALWLGLVALVALGAATLADLPDVGRRLQAAPDMWLAVAGSALTTVLGALAAFELGMPDRRSAWALLPVPSVALWVGASGLGCLRGWTLPAAHDASMMDSMHCLRWIVGFSIPLSIVLVLMLRRACPLRPSLTAAVGGLTAAAAAATLLVLFHPFDASLSDLAVHGGAVLAVVLANQAFGGRILSAAGRVPASDRDGVSRL